MSRIKEVSKETSININELRGLVEETCLSCYGIKSLASKEQLKDLKVKGKIEQGIDIEVNRSSIIVNLYVVVAHGCKASETLRECQKKILYVVGKQFSKLSAVNITAVDMAR